MVSADCRNVYVRKGRFLLNRRRKRSASKSVHKLLSQINMPIHHGINDDVGERVGIEFGHNVLAMGNHRGQADMKFVGNFLVDE